MTGLPNRVPDYTTKMTLLEVATMLDCDGGAVETREEHAQDTDYAQSGLVEKVGKIVGGH